MNNVIVIGANGMLGSVVSRYLAQEDYDVTSLTSKEFDILHAPIDSLSQYLNDDTVAVINCAGVIKPRIPFYKSQDVFKINSWFPIQLGKYLANWDTWIDYVHISTDCVFTGNRGAYQENAIPDSMDLYGMSKMLGESCYPDGMVIRTSIIGEELKNKYSLLEWVRAQANREVSGWTDHIWSGVTTLQLAKFIATCMNYNNIEHEIVHYASEPINKYNLLKLINEVYSLNLDVKEVDSGVPCDRSLEVIGNDYLAPDLKLQLKELKEFFDNEPR